MHLSRHFKLLIFRVGLRKKKCKQPRQAECRKPENDSTSSAVIYRRRFVQCRALGCLQHREKCYIMNIKIPVQPLSQRYSRLETNKQPLPDVNCCSSLQDLNAAIMILKRVERINGIAKWRRRRDYLNAHDVNRFDD